MIHPTTLGSRIAQKLRNFSTLLDTQAIGLPRYAKRTEYMVNCRKPWEAYIGEIDHGDSRIDIRQWKNLLIAGYVKSGKTTILRSIVTDHVIKLPRCEIILCDLNKSPENKIYKGQQKVRFIQNYEDLKKEILSLTKEPKRKFELLKSNRDGEFIKAVESRDQHYKILVFDNVDKQIKTEHQFEFNELISDLASKTINAEFRMIFTCSQATYCCEVVSDLLDLFDQKICLKTFQEDLDELIGNGIALDWFKYPGRAVWKGRGYDEPDHMQAFDFTAWEAYCAMNPQSLI